MEGLLLWIWLMISNPIEYKARLSALGAIGAAPVPVAQSAPTPKPLPRPCRPC